MTHIGFYSLGLPSREIVAGLRIGANLEYDKDTIEDWNIDPPTNNFFAG